MKCAIVTGATSFIAVHLIDRLLSENYFVYAIVRPNSMNTKKLVKHSRLHVIELGLNELDKLPNYIPKADIFFHFAWEGVRGEERDNVSMQKNNISATLNAVQVAKTLKCEIFVGSGSQAEYGIPQGLITEETPTYPLTAYGKAKLEAGLKSMELGKELDIRVIWTRIFSVYGRGDYSQTLIASSIQKMGKNEKVQMGPCTQMWNYVYVEDVAEAFLQLCMCDKALGVYNLASTDTRPLKEFILEMKTIMGSSSELEFQNNGNSTNGFQPSISKLIQVTGYEPTTLFSDGIISIISDLICK